MPLSSPSQSISSLTEVRLLEEELRRVAEILHLLRQRVPDRLYACMRICGCVAWLWLLLYGIAIVIGGDGKGGVRI